MFRVPTAWLALVLIGGAAPVKDPKSPPAKVLNVASAQQPSPNDSSPYDAEAERELFDLANQARAQEGIAPLQMDEGLTQAARAHAAVMAGTATAFAPVCRRALPAQRLAANCTLHLDRAGENVSVAGNVEQSHQGLMHSPPHRENLLNPGYNVAGFGVVRVGGSLYVAQDFATQSASLFASASWRPGERKHRPLCGGRPICLSCSGWTATPPRALRARWRGRIL